MKEKVTPEHVLEMGEEWAKLLLQRVNPEERVARLSLEERLAGLSARERLAGISREEVLAQYKPEERLAGLSVEEVEAWLAKQGSAGAKSKRSKTKPTLDR